MAEIPERVEWRSSLSDVDIRLIDRIVAEKIASGGGFKNPDGVNAQEEMQQMRVSDLRQLRQRLVRERKRLDALDKAINLLQVESGRAIS